MFLKKMIVEKKDQFQGIWVKLQLWWPYYLLSQLQSNNFQLQVYDLIIEGLLVHLSSGVS